MLQRLTERTFYVVSTLLSTANFSAAVH